MLEHESRLAALKKATARNERRNDATIAFLGLGRGVKVYHLNETLIIRSILPNGKLAVDSAQLPHRGRKPQGFGRNRSSVNAFQVTTEKPFQPRPERPRGRHD